jgi:glycolate oxidase iron-sulfur subunit
MSSGLDALPGLLDCMHCGLCLQSCPTYSLTAVETDSPRGRLFLMRAVAEGRLPAQEAAPALERCLQCRACEPACPSKVPFAQIYREHHSLHGPGKSRVASWLGSKRKMALAARVLRFSRRTGLLRAASALPHKRLRRASAMVPHKPHHFRPAPGTKFPALGEQRGIVALHLGCVEAEFFGNNIQDCIAAVTQEGFEVVFPDQPNCCGAAAAHDGAYATGCTSGHQTLQQLRGFDAILVPAAGCAAFLNELADSTAVMDPMIFLHRAGIRSTLQAVDRKVVYATPCHRENVIGDGEEMRSAMHAIPGLELLESEEAAMCCGAGGTVFLKQPQLTDDIGARKVGFLQQTGATQVVSGNPGCAMQLQAKLRERQADLEVIHPITLLCESLGVAPRTK